MLFWTALLAAFGCALCNGVAAVLQKEGADSQQRAASLAPGLFLRLARNWPFVLGTGLDTGAGGLLLFATHYLPLFLVQSVIASSVVVTFLVERIFKHRMVTRQAYVALALVVGGLVLLASSATVEHVGPISATVRWSIIGAVVPILVLGGACSRSNKPASAVLLGMLSGMAFGGTAVTGRILLVPSPFWHVVMNPVLYAYAAYGIVGILLFTLALQRTSATKVATIVVVTETLLPAAVGLILLGDSVRQGTALFAAVGVVLTVAGAICMTLAQDQSKNLQKALT